METIYKNALVSVSNKEGLVECVQSLFESGTRIVSTGGTAEVLKKAGIQVDSVSEQTQFPEVMDGRVKTLHPHIHIPLLARHGNTQDEKELQSRNLKHFDLVICNLYPFESKVIEGLSEKEQIEFIDVGGVTLLRAAAKNFEKITVVCDPKDYALLNQKISLEERKKLAGKVFSFLSVYDHQISKYIRGSFFEDIQFSFSLGGRFLKPLRYGENPHQKSNWYQSSHQGLHEAEVIQGQELSFNNILDIQSAVRVLREFSSQACFVGVKHNNPCGVACADSLKQAVSEGLKADPLSIFGGIVALNQEVCLEVAQDLSSLFLECVVAPSYSQEALKKLSTKKSLRVLAWKDILNSNLDSLCVYPVEGGFLVQEKDHVQIDWNRFGIQGQKPSTQIQKDLELAWKVSAHLKSNAIALVSNQKTVGLGMGQVDRVHAVELACLRMHQYHPEIKTSVVMASDGFFPFADSVELAAKHGIQWVIQPGGSIKDEEVFKKAQELGVNMVCTHRRHFKH